MPRTLAPAYRQHLIAVAVSAALVPYGAWAMDLAEAPPGTVEPYVRPNVIISVDDSGSMDWVTTSSATGSASVTTPNPDGTWPADAKRINILKHSLKQVFNDTTLLPDKKIRLSWQTLHNNGGSPDAKNVNSSSMKQNSMRILESTHRTKFFSFVDSLKASNGTPSHLMFSQADAYMRQSKGTSSAWASDPGTTGAPYLGCRRSYHIFMSDGRWNGTVSGGSQDDNTSNRTLPDSVVYGSASAATRPYNKLYHDTSSNTLADWAFESWANPLQTSGMTGTMEASADYRKAPATENFGNDSNGTPAVLERYWNPRFNPATWPHMVTYTIGFSNDAITWPGAPTIVAPTQKVPFGYDNSFKDLVTGNRTWPAMNNENRRALDLWHAALNGRGRFYAVNKGEDLEKAFREILGQINVATDPDLSSSATSGSNVSRSEVGKYTAAYEPDKAWKGFVVADKVKPDGTTVSNPDWGGKNTADKLDDDLITDANTRLILSWSDKWTGTQYKGGVPFRWASDESKLSTAQNLWLQKDVGGTDGGAAKGEQRLNYIRGDKTKEGSEVGGYTAAKPYRERKSRQGDIVNSDVWYTGAPAADFLLKGYADFVRDKNARPAMLYVGGNDGMLHGFAAFNGVEKIAYVPKGVLPRLTLLTDPQYNNKHKYFVDGSPMTGDIDMNGGLQDPNDPNFISYAPDWRTLLVGSLGLGGKGYFVLDVTNPAGFNEAGAPNLVQLDRTRGPTEPAPICGALTGAENLACVKAVDEDKDIGFITARPVRYDNDAMRTTQITRMNNNRWAVVLGNGYNSTNQRPVLLVQYLDGDKALLRIPVTSQPAGTGNAKDNGLGAPRLVDLNGDGRADIVYAGDNLGNMWKFDLTNADAANWAVAFGGSPLFTALGPASSALNAPRTKVQPISAAPTVRANDRSKKMSAADEAVRVGGMMVAFGTGRNADKDDPSNVDVQTLYSVLDNTRYRETGAGANIRLEVHPGGGTVPAPTALGTGVSTAKLAQQKFTDVGSAGAAKIEAVQNLNLMTWKDYNGWYLDLPAVGERLLKPIEFYDGSNLLTVWSQVPAKGSNVDPNIESCESSSVDSERQYRTFVNLMDGKPPSVQLVDNDANGTFYSIPPSGPNPCPTCGDDEGVSRVQVSKGPHTIVRKGGGGGTDCMNLDIDAKNNTTNLACMPEQSLRPNWRQLK